MKKFLSLVLALVMTMSLVTVSAGAKDFTDSSKIQYNEAIDVMSAVKVIDGYTDGSFNPSATLTRGAAAKIICNLILGPTTASALVADAAPYSDVPTSNVFAGYIAYCQKTGIISGYADGTFKPANTLTGYAFMKMLLGALGYDATIEGYTGANWSINVAKRALSIGLADDLVGDFNGVKAVNREEACLYAFNTLKATMVEYDSTTNISVGGAQVVIAGSKAKDVTCDRGVGADRNIKVDGKVQFAEKYFDKLKKNVAAAEDDFGRPATVWTLKAEEIGTYAKTPNATYTKSVSLGDIYKDLGMTTKDTAATLYVNGADAAQQTTVTVSKGNDTKLKDVNGKIGDGTLVEAYLDDDNNHVDIVAISVYAGEIQKVAKATSKKDAYVVVNKLSSAAISGFTSSNHNEFETTEFAEDDMVLFTYSESDNSIQTVAKMQTVEGKLTAREIGKNLTVNDTVYKHAKNIYFDGFTENSMNNKSSYTLYLDANGYVLAVKETEFVVSDYALVANITNVSGGWEGNKAKLVLTDGSEKTVVLDKDYIAKGIATNDIVTFSVEDGEYKLKAVSGDVALGTDGTFAVTKNKAAVATTAGTKYADSKTVFVVKDGTNDYKVYTGIKNAPSITADDGNKVAYYCKDGDVLSVVFVQATAGKVAESSKDVVFIAGESVSKRIVDVDDNEYYSYNAVVNGEITTVKVETTATTAGLVPGAKTNAIFNSISVKDGMITNSTAYAGDGVNTIKAESYAFGLKKLSGEYTVGIYTGANNTGLVRMTLAQDVKVYLVNTDGDITAGSVSSIVTDYNDAVLYTIDDGEITNLFIQEVDD